MPRVHPRGTKILSRHRSGYLPTLDGWRSIAIMAVIVQHGYGFTQFGLTKIVRVLHWQGIAELLPTIGEKGVELFFAISGFLITTRLVEEHNAFGRISLKGFYIRRASRILPPAVTYLAIVALLGLLGIIAVHPTELLASLFFFRNYLQTPGWFTGHFWSLAVEEHFYLIWPSLVVLLGLRRSRFAAAVGIMAVLIWRTFDWQAMLTTAKYHTDLRLDGLLVGCLAALFFRELREYLTKRWTVILPALLFVFYFAINGVHTQWLSLAKLGQSLAVTTVIAATVANPDWGFSRLLETKILRWVGSLSYSLYLWQQIFLNPTLVNHRYVILQTVARVAMAFICAYLSYRIIEKPAIRLGHRLAPPATPGRGDLDSRSRNAVPAETAVAAAEHS